MKTSLVALLAALGMLGPMGIDMYLPAFPVIARSLHVQGHHLQLTLSIFLLSLALMTLFYGTLSDTLGRRLVLLWATAIYLLATLAVASSTSLEMLLVWRCLQGLAAGAGGVVGRAIILDSTTGPATLRAMSQFIMAFALAPAIAPVMGGWIVESLGWRAIFGFQAAFSAGLWLWCWYQLPETLPVAQRQRLRLKPLLSAYGVVLRDARFHLPVWAGACAFLVFSLYIGAAATFIVDILALPVTAFGWLCVPLVVGMISGSACSARLAGRWQRRTQLRVGYTIMLLACLFNLGYGLGGAVSVPWAVIALGLATFGLALINPCLSLMALERHPGHRGLANSVFSFLQTLAFALVAGVLAPAVSGSAGSLAATLLIAVLLSVSFALWSERLSDQETLLQQKNKDAIA